MLAHRRRFRRLFVEARHPLLGDAMPTQRAIAARGSTRSSGALGTVPNPRRSVFPDKQGDAPAAAQTSLARTDIQQSLCQGHGGIEMHRRPLRAVSSILSSVAAIIVALASWRSGYGQVAANSGYSDNVVKAYITDFNLIRRNDAGTRIGIAFLHELYKANPALDSSTAVQLSDAVTDSWRRNYGPDRHADSEARIRDLKSLGNTVIAISGGKVSAQNIVDVLKITFDESARQTDAFERRVSLLYGEQVLQQNAATWSNHYALLQRPERILDAIEFTKTNPKARTALSVLVQRVDNVDLDAPVAEWRRHNPEGHQALKLMEIDDKLDRLASSQDELHNEMRRVLQRVTSPANEYLKTIDPSAPAPTQETREKELREKFAPYFAANQLFMAIARNDPKAQAVGRVLDSGLQMGMATAAIAGGAATGWGAVIGLGIAFVNLTGAMGDLLSDPKPSDLEIILSAIQQLRDDLLNLQRDIREQFVQVRVQLYEMMDIINTRFDLLELSLRDQHRDLRDLIVDNSMGIGIINGKLDEVKIEMYRILSLARRDNLKKLEPRLTRPKLTESAFETALDEWWAAAVSQASTDFGPMPAYGPEDGPEKPRFFREIESALLHSTDGWDRLNVLQDAAKRFEHPLATEPIPNPKLWSICATHYIELGARWPGFYTNYDADLKRASEILDAGLLIQRSAGRVIRDDAHTISPAYLTRLLNAYKGQVAEMKRLVGRQLERQTGPQTVFKGFSPFLRADEQKLSPFVVNPDGSKKLRPLDYRVIAPLLTMAPPGPTADGVRFASGFDPKSRHNKPDPNAKLNPGEVDLDDKEIKSIQEFIPAEFRLAEALGLGRIKVGYSAAGVGDEIVVGKSKVVHPGGELPKEIRDMFPLSIGFNIFTRYGKLRLELTGTFTSSTKQETLLIFSRRLINPSYFMYGWAAGKDFTLSASEKVNGLSFGDQFKKAMPAFRKALLDGKAAEIDKKRVDEDRAKLVTLLDTTFSAAKESLNRDVAQEYQQPGGDILDSSRQISGARHLFLHFLCLGLGDWLTTIDEGKDLALEAKGLLDGDQVTRAIDKDVGRYLDPATRDASFNLLSALADVLDKRIQAVFDRHPCNRTKAVPASPDLDATFGHHRMVDDTIVRLEQFIDARNRTRRQ
jgi:hypothetical protein